jgi:DNA gyrase subunit A
MKLTDGNRLVGVVPCDEHDDGLLATRGGKGIRFAVTDVRCFTGRGSEGVAGIKLAAGDEVISVSLLRHVAFGAEERDAYLRRSRAERAEEGAAAEDISALADARYAELKAVEEFVLTVTARGFGKRSSAYDYRVTGRGGQGIVNIDLGEGDNAVVASFPVLAEDQIMLATDKGQVIRTRVAEIRVAGRSTRGVTLFRTEADERVVAIARLREDDAGRPE